MTRSSLTYYCVAVFASILWAQPAAAVDYLVTSPTPSALSAEHQEAVLQTTGQLIMAADSGDTVSVYASDNPELLMQITIPDATGERRLRLLAGDIRQLRHHFTGEIPDTPSTRYDLPRAVSEILRPAVRASDGPVRVISFGSLFHCTPSPLGTFEPGEVPDLGHLFADPEQTPWSTQGRGDHLDGASVYWIYLDGDDDATSEERRAVSEFFGAYYQSLGGSLVELLPIGNRSEALAAALSGRDEPMMEADLDPRGYGRPVIRRVSERPDQQDEDNEAALNDARRVVDRQATQTLQWLDARDAIAYGNAIDVHVYVDASMSWQSSRSSVLASVEAAARVIPEYSPRVRVSVTPFREEPLAGYELGRVRSFLADDGESQTQLSAFLIGVSGEQSSVDLKSITTDSLAELSNVDSPGRTLWVFVTDTVPQEWDQADTEAESQMAEAIRAWVQHDEGHRVLTLYVGDDPESEQARFMGRLADAAGSQGSCTTDKTRIIHDILMAALAED